MPRRSAPGLTRVAADRPAWTPTRDSRRSEESCAVVVGGGGFIGIETAENLVGLGFEVTLLQRGEQIMAPLGPEMAHYVERHLDKHGVQVLLNAVASGFRATADGALEVLTGPARCIRRIS